MGKADVMAREYLSDRERFADMFNYLLYGGGRVIEPERLSPLDSVGTATCSGTNRQVKQTWKGRDMLKVWQTMGGGDTAYAILGLEEQAYVSRAMPVRCMLYDAMSLDRQVRGIAKRNKQAGMKGASSGEFLSGMRSTDNLVPVVTLVLYLKPGEWHEPESLHELMGNADEGVLRYVPDYRVNLVVPSRIDDSEFDKFSTEMGLVLKYVKYSDDDEDLGRMMEKDGRYRELGVESAEFINTITNSRLALEEEEGKVDMCRAIDEMRRKSKEKGIQEGIEKGIAKGDHNRLLESARNLIAYTGWDAMEALKSIGVPEADRPTIARELGVL